MSGLFYLDKYTQNETSYRYITKLLNRFAVEGIKERIPTVVFFKDFL